MQFKKIVPLALALTISTTAAAGAANLDMSKFYNPTIFASQSQRQLLQRLCDRFDISFCGQQVNCPVVKPDNKPEQTPDETPDQQPEETPEQTPEDTPGEELPDQTPDDEPENQPDDQPGQLPDNNRPEGTPDNDTEQTPDGDTGSSQGSFASQVVALVNAERAKEGLSPLTIDARVQQAAQVRAQESAQSFSHTRPNGSSFSTALTEAGVSYRGAGENIAYGQSTPQAVVTAWMNSSGHRANIMSKNFTTLGVGYSVVGGTPYWAQLFTY